MKRTLMDRVQWLICLFVGHPVHETGVSGIVIYQVKCPACNSLFAASREPMHNGGLLPWDSDFEEVIAGDLEMLKRHSEEVK